MLSDWSVECAQDDPVLVVPWSSDPQHSASGPHFVDLRENPYDLDHLPEAEQHPPLMQALRALNAPRSPVFTAKCDAWPMDDDELAAILPELDLSNLEFPAGFTSYIDLIFRDRPLFVSLPSQQQRLTRLARLLDPLPHPHAAVECVLRPALVDAIGPAISGAAEGFAVSLYVKAVGPDPGDAYESWSRALEAVTTVLRSKELAIT